NHTRRPTNNLEEQAMKQRLPGTVLVFTGVAAVGLALLPASSQAGIVFTLGNNPQPGEENVQNIKGSTGGTVFGQTSTSKLPVEFDSTQTLLMPTNGNGPLEAVDASGTQIGLNAVGISVPNHSLSDLIFNPEITGSVGTPGGNFDVYVTDTMGFVSSFEYTL